MATSNIRNPQFYQQFIQYEVNTRSSVVFNEIRKSGLAARNHQTENGPKLASSAAQPWVGQKTNSHRCNCEFCVGGYQCVLCDVKFATKMSLKTHILDHIESFNSCEVCVVKDHNDCVGGRKVSSDNDGLTQKDENLESLGDTENSSLAENALVEETTETKAERGKEAKERVVCEICGKSFPHKTNLYIHLRVHEQVVKCSFCSKNFKESVFQPHLRKAHGLGQEDWAASRPFECELCKKRFLSYRSLLPHIMRHLRRPMKCSLCPKAFPDQKALDTHLEVRHIRVEAKRTCKVCGRYFSQTGNLNLHMRIHTGIKPYECKVCKKAFSYKNGFLDHVATHDSVKQYQCSTCQKGISSKKSLRRHILSHTLERKFVCDACGQAFRHVTTLMRHKTTTCAANPIVCTICSKTFSSRRALTFHSGTHSGKRPFQCDYCDSTFIRERNMRRHIVKNHLDRPHNCEICGRNFYSDHSLKRHRTSHVIV